MRARNLSNVLVTGGHRDPPLRVTSHVENTGGGGDPPLRVTSYVENTGRGGSLCPPGFRGLFLSALIYG